MTFRLNDYDSFLSSLYQSSNEEKEVDDGKFPLHFDFGLHPIESRPEELDLDQTTSTASNSYGYTYEDMDQLIKQEPLAEDFKAQTLHKTKTYDSSEDEFSPSSDLKGPQKYKTKGKCSHNVIEQRYRNKINDKFMALQNSVPTLRVVSKKKGESEDESFEGDLEGLEPARKLNKGIILAKSIEYIKFLELKNDRMRQQQTELLEKAKLLGISTEDL